MRHRPTASSRPRQVRVERHTHLRPAARCVMPALVRQARERRSPFLRADLLADDHFALRALATVGLLRTWSAHGTYTGLIDLGLGTALVQTPSLTTPSEILPVQSVHEAVGTATTPSGLEGLR